MKFTFKSLGQFAVIVNFHDQVTSMLLNNFFLSLSLVTPHSLHLSLDYLIPTLDLLDAAFCSSCAFTAQ